ncbi:MAG: Flp family type IVb pilin [Rhodospirillales bacterium]
MEFVTKLFKDESGATAIEYGLIAALIAAVIVGSVTALGNSIKGTFTNVASEVAKGAGG